MMSEIIAPCGIDCGICPVFIATRNDDAVARQRLAEQFFSQHDKDIDPETIVCDGCPGQGRTLGFCSVCQIRACAYGKGYATCAECDAFPCETGQFIWQKNSASLETLNRLRG
jgi:hypothetical protein